MTKRNKVEGSPMVSRRNKSSAPNHCALWMGLVVLFSLMPGCQCTATKVTYGDEVDSDTESKLAAQLEQGIRRCGRSGESDTCVSDDDFFDEHERLEDFRLALGRSSCRVDEQAQVIAIATFGSLTPYLVVGTFSQGWVGAWELDRVELIGLFPSHLRICEPFGEHARHEDVTVLFGDDDEKEALGE